MELSLLNPAMHHHRGLAAKPSSGLPLARRSSVVRFRVSASAAAAPPKPSSSGPKKRGKKEIQETLLTPRFYTTDFDEMELLFNGEINKQLNQAEFDALLQEFKTDYNQTHFVRNPEFKEAADKMQGPLRQIFVEFLERSCTAEFSGFLLYKELGRRLKVRSLLCFCILGGHFHERLVGMCSCPVFPCRKPTRWWPRSSRSCPGTRHAMPGIFLIQPHSALHAMKCQLHSANTIKKLKWLRDSLRILVKFLARNVKGSNFTTFLIAVRFVYLHKRNVFDDLISVVHLGELIATIRNVPLFFQR
jgi:hypothetical protein